jgi:hypothetical protein
MLTASFAAAGAGLSGVALAASGGLAAGGGTGGTGSAVTSGLGSLVGGSQAAAPASLPAAVCSDAASLLGLGLVGCGGSTSAPDSSASGSSAAAGGTGATSGSGTGTTGIAGLTGSTSGGTAQNGSGAASGSGQGGRVGQGGQSALSAPASAASATPGNRPTAARGQAGAPASAAPGTCGDTAAVLGDSAAGCEDMAGAGVADGHTFADTPETGTAPSRRDAAAPALAGAGAIGGNGSNEANEASGNRSLPATTLAADSATGLSNVSIYSLAIGALVAGAVALKMAGRRFRGHNRATGSERPNRV